MATRVPTIVHVSGNCFGNGRTIGRTRTVFGHTHSPSEVAGNVRVSNEMPLSSMRTSIELFIDHLPQQQQKQQQH